MINCNQCGLQYIGETKRAIRNRMYEHYSSVQRFQGEKATPVSRHFTQKNHSVKNMELSILQWMGDPTSPNATTRCRRRELYYLGIPYTPPSRHQHVCLKLCPLIAPITQVPPFFYKLFVFNKTNNFNSKN